jgi:predicted RNA-binding protein YlxR (DUF448 family)
MRQLGILAGLAVLAAAGAAAAQQSVQTQPTDHEKGRVLYVCDRSQETEKSFERRYGEIRFVTAREALAANRRHEQWAAPRCIDDREYQKLMALVADQNQTIRLSAR